MSKNSELFRLETEDYDPFEGKALEMLKNLLNHCNSFHAFHDCEGKINFVFERKDEDKS